MLKKRIVSVLTLLNGKLHRTRRFRPDYLYVHSQVDLWEIDELVILDITRQGRGTVPFVDAARHFADDCFVPTSWGGGVVSVETARSFFAAGADKVAVNTAALERPPLIDEIAKAYGCQALVVSIDARENEVVADCGRTRTGRDPVAWAKEAADRGAGEILLNTVEKDGSLTGYDYDLIHRVASAVRIPVMALGGGGSWEHFRLTFEAGADAACTQNIYHFTRASILAAKKYLGGQGVPVRP